ncbi:probable ribosome biogenesis protein RLP24 [Oncorhynchus tshawytscha]|uniref:probable ribosome biogenesis protein RLP24 n=1 Tax=Oncorhynchus tshawytscha TaxID=74940 RepID=UPI001C3C3AF6|nr:probable ribosome biogenesis protein RLP24 [Oncorhynchus tshawytscha]
MRGLFNSGHGMMFDNSLEFEKRGNIPVKYRRELWDNSHLSAMKKVEEIKQKRQAKFIMKWLKKGKQLEKEEAISKVKKNIHLIKAPHAGQAKQLEEKMWKWIYTTYSTYSTFSTWEKKL